MATRAFYKTATAMTAWLFYGAACLLLAICLSWSLYGSADYGYRFWYQQLGIAEHIQQYGPQNRFKDGFEALPEQAHWQAFSQIVAAVHNGGEGLAEIVYQPPGAPPRALLHRDEIIHLQDVAVLLDWGKRLMVLLLLLWLPLAWWCRRGRALSLGQRTIAAAIPLGAVLLWLLIAGPTAVFYQLHIWVFPAENPWFFYWEDSLMSTLMKAPVLFAGIAAVIAALTLLLTPIFYWLGLYLVRRAMI